MIFLFALLNEASHVSLKKQCPDVEVLHAQKSRHIGVQDQISTTSNLPIFYYSCHCCGVCAQSQKSVKTISTYS